MEPVRAEGVRTLYLQMRNTAISAVVVTIYMVGVSWAFTPWRVIAAWTAVQLAAQAARLLLIGAFDRRPRADAELAGWARAYSAHQFAVGLIWGACMFLFAHPAEPVTVALTLCCLYSIGAGGVPPMANYPPAFAALIATMHLAILVRLLATGMFGYAMLGIASTLYGVMMLVFCRVQARAVRESFRIRFENRELLQALGVEKAEAEQARRKAESADLAKSQFLAAASHDLRQPLYALSLYSASLTTLDLDDSARTVVRSIQDSIEAMESLFNGLLDLSKLQAGVIRVRIAPVAVDALFDRLSQYFLPVAMSQGLDLRFRSDGECVASDPVLLEQVLSNLVANALRYTRAGGVLVAARPRGGEVRFEVWDTGVGISESAFPRIFEEFVQIGNPERDRRKGLGLGLAIARRAADILGARIVVASRPGIGSRFSFAQPIHAARASPFPAGRDADTDAAPLLGLRTSHPLLIVDDDPAVRAAIRDLLGRWDMDIEVVPSAEAALARADAGVRFGALLCDYRLGGACDGLELIATLRARLGDPRLPAALITGDPGIDVEARARAGGVRVLAKPLRAEELGKLLGRNADIGRK